MIERKSYYRMEEMKKELIKLENIIDDCYKDIVTENRNELLAMKTQCDKEYEELRTFYNKIGNSMSLRMELIKERLPWYLRKLKITSTEIGLTNGLIYIGVNFRNQSRPNLYIHLTINDIR